MPDDEKFDRSDTRTRHRLFLTLAVVAAVALVVVGFRLLGGSGTPEPKTVDFSEVQPEPQAPPEEPVLRVAVGAMISPEETRKFYDDLLRLVGRKMGRRTVFLQRKTYAEVNELVENREVDMAFVCAGPYVEGHNKFGMELLAVPETGGKTVYHSYIIVPEASAAQSFEDLRGKRFAFTDPHSNTGYLVPRYMLARLGETPTGFFGETFFTHSHDNSIRAVAGGQADGAAVDSLIWEFMNATDPTETSHTRIVEKSPPYGIPPVVVHPALAPEIKASLRETLLSLARDETAKSYLKRLNIDGFVAGDDAMYESVRSMERWIKDHTE